MITFILCACLIWQTDTTERAANKEYRTCIGIGFSSSLGGSCDVSAEYGFSDRWSVAVSAGFNISDAFTAADRETAEHHQEFDEETTRGHPSGPAHHESFSIAFWPQGAFKGISLGFGVHQSSKLGVDALVAISYNVPIYERLAACISGSIRGISMMQKDKEDALAAGVKLLYRF